LLRKIIFHVNTQDMTENIMHIAWALAGHIQSLKGGREARDWDTDESAQGRQAILG
jgi:hypothetical protein